MVFSSWLRNRKRTRTPKVRPHRKAPLRLEKLEDRLCPSAAEALGNLPLAFEANAGQTDAQVNFLSRGAGYAAFLTPTEAVLSLASESANDTVRLQILGGNPRAPGTGLDLLPGRTSYLLGNDPSQWHTDVANYGRVRYAGVYAGIDLVYYGNQRNLEYDFVVAPGADPGAIRLNFDGTQGLSLDAAGNLVLHTSGGDLVEHAPVVYQDIGGVRQSVAGSYRLLGQDQVGFTVGAHDATRPLVIDPVLSYSTFLGGSNYDYALSIAVDAAGSAYVTGYTGSADFPTLNPLQSNLAGATRKITPSEVFVTKLNAAGTALIYSTYLGGSSDDHGYHIAVDGSGNAFVTGDTYSTDFPTKNALQTTYAGNGDGFVVELNATGSALLYSTYLGGSSAENWNDGASVGGIAVDGPGYVYVTGGTGSANFPTTPGAFQTAFGAKSAFITKIDPTQTGAASLVYSTYLGTGFTRGTTSYGIAVDGSGQAYVTGRTDLGFPTIDNAFQRSFDLSNNVEAFVSVLDANGSALLYSSYFSGSGGTTAGGGIAVDFAGNIVITGSTSCLDLPTKNALQPTKGGPAGTIGYDAFVAKFNPNLAGADSLLWSTYLGGRGNENGPFPSGDGDIAVDAAGNVYVTGQTESPDFPSVNAFQPTMGSSQEGFVAKLAADGSRFVYSSFLGGGSTDRANGIAVDAVGSAYVAGYTLSSNFPVTPNAFQRTYGGGSQDGFVAKIADATRVSPTLVVTVASSTTSAGAIVSFTVTATDADGNTLTGFMGTVHFTSTDPKAVLPADYTFTADDQGVHAFSSILKTAGAQLLTAATAGMMSGQASIQVNAAAATRLALSGPSGTKASAGFSITVTLYDAYGNVATGYTGTVHLSSTDKSATMPADYTFTAADSGRHTFTGVKLKTRGKQTITAIDNLMASLADSLTIDVT
jgi:hypothetical protein